MREAEDRVRKFMMRIPSQAISIPKGPTIPDLDIGVLRAKLMLEECLETINAMGFMLYCGNTQLTIENVRYYNDLPTDLIDVADGLADELVVTLGAAIHYGIQIAPIFDEVMYNNELKLEKGAIDEFGKLVKPPNHPKPRIEFLIQRQIENAK